MTGYSIACNLTVTYSTRAWILSYCSLRLTTRQVFQKTYTFITFGRPRLYISLGLVVWSCTSQKRLGVGGVGGAYLCGGTSHNLGIRGVREGVREVVGSGSGVLSSPPQPAPGWPINRKAGGRRACRRRALVHPTVRVSSAETTSSPLSICPQAQS